MFVCGSGGASALKWISSRGRRRADGSPSLALQSQGSPGMTVVLFRRRIAAISREIARAKKPDHTMKNFAYVLALALSAVFSAPAHAAEAPQQRMIVVSGEGEVLAKPDQARITAAVVTQAPTAEQAAQGNAAAMNRVLNALSMLGIPPAKIQT